MRRLLALLFVLLAVPAMAAEGPGGSYVKETYAPFIPLDNIFNLRGATDSSGNLLVVNASAAGQTPLTPIGQLLGRTDGSGNLFVNCSGCSPTAPQTLSNNGIGSTSTDALILSNTTAAAAGAQQWSGRIRWIGQGWKTNATAGSQQVEMWAEIQPVQGAASPTANLHLGYSVNSVVQTPALDWMPGLAAGPTLRGTDAGGQADLVLSASGNPCIYNSSAHSLGGLCVGSTITTIQAGGTGSVTFTSGLLSKYNNVTTAGWGVPAIQSAGRSVAQTAAVGSVATYTVGAADGSFEVSANVLVTTATTHSFNVTCAYTDEGNTARTVTLNFSTVAGAISNAAITNAGGAVPYEGIPLHIRAKAATAITIATTGTFTTVTYNVEGSIRQIS